MVKKKKKYTHGVQTFSDPPKAALANTLATQPADVTAHLLKLFKEAGLDDSTKDEEGKS